MKLTNKILIILILLLAYLFFSNVVFGFTVTDYFEKEINIPEIPDNIDISHGYLYIYTSGWGYQLKVLNNEDSYFYHDGDVRIILAGSGTSYQYTASRGWYYQGSLNNGADTRINNAEQLYFSTSVYSDVNKTGFFFQHNVILPAMATVEEIPKAIITTLKMILPVGLVVFGTLLLVYIIRLLILRVT